MPLEEIKEFFRKYNAGEDIGELMSDVVSSYKVRWEPTASGFHDFSDIADELAETLTGIK